MNIQEFDPVIYPYKIWIAIDESPADIQNLFNGYDGKRIETLEYDTSRLAAFAMPVISKDGECGVVLYFRSAEIMSYELVAHESSHAAKYLFKHINADVSEHEPFEFVIGWIAGCCENVKNELMNLFTLENKE